MTILLPVSDEDAVSRAVKTAKRKRGIEHVESGEHETEPGGHERRRIAVA
jgi:hypothetical protein